MDGKVLIDIAEDVNKEIEIILQRMRQVAVQGASDNNKLQEELPALLSEPCRTVLVFNCHRRIIVWFGSFILMGMF